MADVSVEFGAKDTGLENALKTVQDELTRLDEKVKGGELSFKELESSMKRIAQVEKLQEQLQGMADSTKKAGDAADVAAPKATELGNTMQDAGNKAQGSAGLFDSSFAKISAAFTVGNIAAQAFEKIIQTAFDIARAAAQGFSDALDLGGRLNELSVRTGEAAGKLLVLETAFKNSGLEADQVGMAINKLQNFMADATAGGEKQTSAMNNLGISMSELNGKTPTQQMQVFADKISAIKDPTDRAAAASEIFGDKLGGKLLSVLTDFSGNLEDARTKVGSLEQIMDENAATFDAAGETIDAVKGKMAAFAAGILSEVIPEVQDLGTAMEEVDAAGLGQEIGSALAPVLRDFSGVVNEVKLLMDQLSYAEQQAREDTGALGMAYNTTQGALEAFNNGLFDALKYVTPFDESIESLRERFVGYRKDQDGAIVGLENLGAAAAEAKPKLDALPGAGEKLNLEFENLPKTIESTFPLIEEFKANLDNAAPSVTAIGTETGVVKSDFSEISSLTAQLPAQNDAFTQSILGTNEQLSLQPGIHAEIFQKLSEAQAKEEERRLALEQSANRLQASVELQIQLNEAIASGNVKEQARVQKLIDAEAAQKRIKRLTDQYIASGLGEKEAGQLAANLVNSEIAAANVKKNVKGTKTELDNAGESVDTVKKKVERLYGTPMDKPAKGFKEEVNLAREQLFKLQTFVGEDLSKMSLSSIIDKLGLDDAALQSSETQLMAIQRFISDLGKEKPADVTPEIDVPGSRDNIAQIKKALKETEGTDATPQIDQESVKQQASAARKTVEDDLKKVEATVTVKPKLDKEALKEEVDMAFASSKGTQHLSNIDKLVETIKGFVEKIEGKLPLQALA